MSEQVAVKRHTLRGAPRTDGGRGAAIRPSGRRLLLLAALACASMAAFAAGAAQSLAAGLPDNRAYELVSPAVKAAEVEHLVIIAGDQAAPDGNALGYVALSPVDGSNGPGIDDLATRGANGWTTKDMLPPQAPGVTLNLPGYALYSGDLSKGILSNGGATLGGLSGQDFPFLDPGTCTTALFPTPPATAATPCTGEPTGRVNAFVVNLGTGAAQLVDSFAHAPAGTTPQADAGSAPVGATPDLSTVVFTDDAQLTPGASSSVTNLYAWNSATGDVTLLGAGASLGQPSFPPRVLNAVDNNGSSANIFVTDATGDLEVFRGGSSTPTQIAASVTNASGTVNPSFMTAATDGSVAFFTDGDGAALTGNTVAGSGANLYEYNTASGTTTDLTGGQSLAQVDGVLGASSDGSSVYFVAEGVLASGATSGAENLYVEHSGTTRFIATLTTDQGDSSDWNGQDTARVTPDGTHLAFDSDSSPLAASTDHGFNNLDANSGTPDEEIYLYDATSGSLVCASCNVTGKQPIGSASLDPVEGGLTGNGGMYLQHNLSDDGSRLFFDSFDAIVPTDTNFHLVNGQGVGRDVYEYENGQKVLLTSGTSDDDSMFYDATPSGNDVFFATRDQLVPQDIDGQQDIYDARVNGGFPVPSPLPPCVGNACRPGTTQLPPPVIATVTFVGPGNQKSSAPKSKKKKAKIAVLSRVVVKGFRFSIKVRVPASGKLAVSGTGLNTMRKQVRAGHSYKLTLGLTAGARRALERKHKGRVKIMVHLLYKPAAGASSSATVPVTVKA
jgi:hypothetical protein